MTQSPTASSASIDDVLSRLEAGFEARVEELCALARIPSVSADGFPRAEVARSAEAVAALLRASGFEDVEVLEVEGAHPYVVGDWSSAGPEAPTPLRPYRSLPRNL